MSFGNVGGVISIGDAGGVLEYDGEGVRSRSSAKWTRFLGAIVRDVLGFIVS